MLPTIRNVKEREREVKGERRREIEGEREREGDK
jgi:hypothetical protein